MNTRWTFTALLWVALSAAVPSAQAQPQGSALFTPLGVSVSGIQAGGDFKPAYGVELSVANMNFDNFAWAGVFGAVDVVGNGEMVRATVGPELGWLCLGVDLGLLLTVRDGNVESGARARAHVTFFSSSVYLGGGVSSAPDTPSASSQGFFELGLLLKYPFQPGK